MNNNITILNDCQINITIAAKNAQKENIFEHFYNEIDEEFNKIYREKKLSSIKIQKAYQKINKDKANRIEQCFTVAQYWKSADGTKQKLIYANSCRVRLCPSCAWRRSMKYYKENKEIFQQLEKEKLRYIFLTLTVKNSLGENLKDNINKLIEGYHRIMKYKEVKKVVVGTIRSAEITFNRENNTFHPHIHAIIAVNQSYFGKDYITQEQWTKLWQRAIGADYAPVTDIRAFKAKKSNSLAEISKYIIKYSDILNLPQSQLEYVVKILDEVVANRRFISYSGIFKAKRLELKYKDNLDEGTIIDNTDEGALYLMRWHWGYMRYEQTTKDKWYQSSKEQFNLFN